MKQIHKFIFYILLSSILLIGCISTNRENCTKTQLHFSYNGDGEANIFLDKIDKVNVYIFDKDEKYLFSKIISGNDLQSNPYILLDLEPGRYNIVCVGNAYENSAFTDFSVGKLENIFVTNPQHLEQDRKPARTNDPLYMARGLIDVPQSGYLNETMVFHSAHFDVIIEVEGLTISKTDEIPIRVSLINMRPSTSFTNQSKSDYLANLHPKIEYDSATSKIKLHFQIMRHSINDPLNIVIINRDGKLDSSISYREFIEKNNINITKQEVYIPILVSYTSLGVIASLPDWAIENIDPDFE